MKRHGTELLNSPPIDSGFYDESSLSLYSYDFSLTKAIVCAHSEPC